MADADFLIVGLGASAGGVDALRDFFAHVPDESGLAFVVILHLSPTHESRLAEIIQTTTAIPVTQVHERVRVEPNHIYVIPPSRSLSMVDGDLALSDIRAIEERRAPIDIFFRTLAATHPSRAVGVVLSGTGADGSMGLKTIKEGGGVCLAQDPAEAQYGEMPRNSIATGVVDHVLPAAGIPAKIIALREHIALPSIASPSEPGEPDEHALRDLFAQLKAGTGHDFSNYKRATVLRRIRRRMAVTEVREFAAYAEIVRRTPRELQALFKDLLISVTHFFRDRAAFEVIERRIIPEIFQRKGADDQVRVWVPGCATGEEAYSLAMLLVERAETLAASPSLQVFATDIDASSLTVARQGLYTDIDTADVSPARLERFFIREDNAYRVRPELRQVLLFSHHDIIKDPPFSHLDLASCRNLLIYLNRPAQRRVFDVLHFALAPGAFLFLGTSESIDSAADLFQTVERDAHVFQRRAQASRLGVTVPDGRSYQPMPPAAAEPTVVRPVPPRIGADLHQRILEEFAPPSVIVNAQYDIVHMSTRGGQYLQFSGGAASTNLLAVLRPELRHDVRAALYQARQQMSPVETGRLSFSRNDRPLTLKVIVRPVAVEGSMVYLVLFQEILDASAGQADAPVPVRKEDLLAGAEEELAHVRAQLRSTVERHQRHVEEHKASLEEQQAMNEELRSASEELETSREELQSLNEELQTVNQELKIKIEEQAQANDDMRNLVGATEIGTIFLDRKFRIKFFTPAVRAVFHIIDSDRGRPLSDIASVLTDVDAQEDGARVLETLERVERTVRTRDGRWLLMRVHPYRTADDRIDGVVFSFVDVTERKLIDERIRISEERLRRAAAVDNVGVMFFRMDGTVTDANDAFLRMTGTSRALLQEGRLRRDDLGGSDSPEALHAAHEFETLGRTVPFEREHVQPDGGCSWALCAATRISPDEGVEFAVDLTLMKETEARLNRSESRHRLIVDGIVEYAVFTMDERGRIDHWNPGAERMFGYGEQEIVGQNVSILFVPEDRLAGKDEEELRQARAEGRAADERWHVRKDGSRFFASGVTSLLRDDEGDVQGFVKVARDLTERKRWEDALRRAHDDLELRVDERTAELGATNRALDSEVQDRRDAEERIRRLLARMISAQEDERRRIARDLHDHIGQQLVGLRLKLDALQHLPETSATLLGKLNEAHAMIAQVDRDIDFFTWELRPAALDDLGLDAAIRNFVAEWSLTFGIAAEFHAEAWANTRLSPDCETNIYRITQEALNNVYKHAHATTVSVLLERRGDEAVVIIEDDGQGFEPDAPEPTDTHTLGLLGMRERAALCGGTIEFESAPGGGTTVFVRVPTSWTTT